MFDSAKIAMYLSKTEKVGLTDSETIDEEDDSVGDTVSELVIIFIFRL